MYEIPKYLFVVDTDTPTDQFGGELFAWMTGMVGDGPTHTDDLVELAQRELPKDVKEWLADNVRDILCSDGDEETPYTLWATPGYFNDGWGNEWPEHTPPKKVERAWRSVVDGYYESVHKPEEYKECLEHGPGRYPAYNSVAIFLEAAPPDEVLVLLMQRAESFPWKSRSWTQGDKEPPFYITGFRLLTLSVNEVKKWIYC